MRYIFVILILVCAVLQAAQPVIPIERYTLKNGMRVILSRDNAVPVVTIYLIFDVGARAEEKGRTGFAHLFEHMMFEGSAHAPKGTHFKLVESNGGTLNGSTHPDYTDYFEVLPANKLAVGLWLESDRMRSLAITPENLANQKEAVKQERRLSFDNRPYSTAIVDRWPQVAYQNWQNSHSLIGSFEDLTNTDCVMLQYWVEIPDSAQLQRFQQFVDNYTIDQKQHGRFPRPTNNRIVDVPTWLQMHDVIGDDSRLEVVLALLFLVVCILNTLGLMLAKFLGAASITGLRRALGASRKQIIQQHLVEVVVVGTIGGAVGLVLAWTGLWAIRVMTYVPGPDDSPDKRALAESLSHMDYRMVGIAIGISLLTGVLAGLYPAWRIGKAAPASFLKAQ